MLNFLTKEVAFLYMQISPSPVTYVVEANNDFTRSSIINTCFCEICYLCREHHNVTRNSNSLKSNHINEL